MLQAPHYVNTEENMLKKSHFATFFCTWVFKQCRTCLKQQLTDDYWNEIKCQTTLNLHNLHAFSN